MFKPLQSQADSRVYKLLAVGQLDTTTVSSNAADQDAAGWYRESHVYQRPGLRGQAT